MVRPCVMSVVFSLHFGLFSSILVCFSFTFNHRFDYFSVLVFLGESIGDLLVFNSF